jgi:hypothetical protein
MSNSTDKNQQPSLKDRLGSMAIQMEKLPAAVTAQQGSLAQVDNLAASLGQVEQLKASFATLQGNQGQLTVAINRLQSEKLGDVDASASCPTTKTTAIGTSDVVAHATKHGHKLLFPTFDGSEDPLQWLNRCDQFFHIQETSEAGKVFLATFYMSGEASQWYTLLERNRSQPSWDKFIKLVNQRFGPPLRSNTLGELIQLQREGSVADYQSKFLSLLARCEDLAEKH